VPFRVVAKAQERFARQRNANRIDAKFADLRRLERRGLIPFVEAGDPDLETTLEILLALERSGADLIELGVPFSDPMAEGITIQRSSERALRAGATLPRILELVREFRRRSQTPLILFGYYNPFFRFGLGRLCREAREAGVDGILCVDLPPEESGELKRGADRAGLRLIYLLAPTSDEGRIRAVLRRASGFIYYVSVTGVTGARERLLEPLEKQVARLRRFTELPIAVGFGISRPEQASRIASFADAAVVGSALIDAIAAAPGRRDKVRRAGEFLSRLRRAIDGARPPRS
jgi:tryptophan synthase alpha chain